MAERLRGRPTALWSATAALLVLLLFPARAPALTPPSDPFDQTDRFALLLRDSTGRLVEIQAKVRSPDREALPAGELRALLRYQLREGAGLSRPRVVLSRPLPISSLPTTPTLVRFTFAPALTEIVEPRLQIFYGPPPMRPGPSPPLRLVKDVFPEEILFGTTAPTTQTTVLPPALASPGTVVFGPMTLMRARGAPVTDTLSFTLPDTTGPFLLELVNGDVSGAHRVSSAVVTLNGQSVFRPRDFNQQIAGLTRQVILQSSNTLTVELRSAPPAPTRRSRSVASIGRPAGPSAPGRSPAGQGSLFSKRSPSPGRPSSPVLSP